MSRQRFVIPGLIILALVLGVVSFVLVSRNQTNSNGQNIPAGQVFGISTDKTTLDKVNNGLQTAKCNSFLSSSLLKPTTISKTDPMFKTLWTTFSIDELPKQDLLPKYCSYSLASNIKIKLAINTYNKDSQLPDNKLDFYNGIVAHNLNKIIDSGDNDSDHTFKYTYGVDASNNLVCKTLFIHSTSDFNYGEITYQNLVPCDSQQNIQINKTIFSTIVKQLNLALNDISK